MDIVIKGMEMPSCCSACKLVQRYRYSDECQYLNKKIAHNGRLKDCPLVALPEHGDLIERNALPIIGITDYKLESHTVVEFEDVQNAPVIVEANNE